MKVVLPIVGVLLVLLGALWIGQGLGYIGGSFMTSDPTWAIIGVVVVLVGVGLGVFGLRRGRH